MKKVLIGGIAGLVFSAGGAFAGNGDLVVDGNLGVGTASPAAKVQITGGDMLIDDGYAIRSGQRAGASLLYRSASGAIFLGSGTPTDYVVFNSGGGEKARIDAYGNLDLGTTSSVNNALLSINGKINAGNNWSVLGTVLLEGRYPNGTLAVVGTEYSGGGPMVGYAVSPSTSSYGSFLSSTGINVERSAIGFSDSIRFYTGPLQTSAVGTPVTTSEVMRITNTGSVGIGTSNPTSKFQVATGDIAISAQSYGVILRASDGPNCFRLTVNNAGSVITTPVSCP